MTNEIYKVLQSQIMVVESSMGGSVGVLNLSRYELVKIIKNKLEEAIYTKDDSVFIKDMLDVCATSFIAIRSRCDKVLQSNQ